MNINHGKMDRSDFSNYCNYNFIVRNNNKHLVNSRYSPKRLYFDEEFMAIEFLYFHKLTVEFDIDRKSIFLILLFFKNEEICIPRCAKILN